MSKQLKTLVRSRHGYAARPGGILNNTQAAIVGRELERIQVKHGCILAEKVVDESRAVEAILHEHFTWDDTIAGENYRCFEARNLIRSVRIIDNSIPAAEQPVIRAFVSVKAHDQETKFEGQAYITTEWAEKDEDYKHQVINKAKDELRNWQRRYDDYKQYFSGVWRAIDTLSHK